MKKIISNKVYDTDKAKFIGCDSYSHPGDFNYWSESLYQKKTGEFFLYGEGGAATKYSVEISNNEWRGGAKIIPMSYDAAKAWTEEHLDADQYIETFGEPEEDDSKERLTITLPSVLITNMKRNAAKAGISLSAYVEKHLKGDDFYDNKNF